MESSNYLFIVICYFKMIPMGYIKYSASMQYAQFTYTFDHITWLITPVCNFRVWMMPWWKLVTLAKKPEIFQKEIVEVSEFVSNPECVLIHPSCWKLKRPKFPPVGKNNLKRHSLDHFFFVFKCFVSLSAQIKWKKKKKKASFPVARQTFCLKTL